MFSLYNKISSCQWSFFIIIDKKPKKSHWPWLRAPVFGQGGSFVDTKSQQASGAPAPPVLSTPKIKKTTARLIDETAYSRKAPDAGCIVESLLHPTTSR